MSPEPFRAGDEVLLCSLGEGDASFVGAGGAPDAGDCVDVGDVVESVAGTGEDFADELGDGEGDGLAAEEFAGDAVGDAVGEDEGMGTGAAGDS